MYLKVKNNEPFVPCKGKCSAMHFKEGRHKRQTTQKKVSCVRKAAASGRRFSNTKALRYSGTGRHVSCSTWHELVGILVSCHIGGPLYCPPVAARANNLPSSPSPSPRVLRHQRDPAPRVGWWLRVVADSRTNPEAVVRVSCWDTSKHGGFHNPETVILHQLCLRRKPNSFFFFI